MKAYSLTLILATSTSAIKLDVNSKINQALQNAQQDKISETFKTFLQDIDADESSDSDADGQTIQTMMARRMPGQWNTNFLDLNGYGCWCYFDQDLGKGKSVPVDIVDGFCRNLAEAYECIQMDDDEERTEPNNGYHDNQVCIPWEVDYRPPESGVTDEETIRIQCTNRNSRFTNKNCRIRSCIAETMFTNNVLAHIFSNINSPFNRKYFHNKGFNVDSECPVLITTNSDATKACCGEYPSRRPYKTFNGQRGCCDGKTYSTLAMFCCDDGITRTSC